MRSWRKFFFYAATILAAGETGWCQKTPNWHVYKLADGLPESACLSVTLSSQGKVLARHLNAPLVSELDGYGVSIKSVPESGKGRIYQSPGGGQYWTVVPQGLREFKDGSWLLHPVREIAAEPHISTVLDPVPLYPIKQGLVAFLLSDRLMEFNSVVVRTNTPQAQVLRMVSQTRLGRFIGMVPARDGGLWISGAHGLAKVPGPLRNLKPETEWREYPIPETLGIENLQAPHEVPSLEAVASQRPVVIALAEFSTNHQKVVISFDGQAWNVDGVPPRKPRQVWCGPDETRWEMTIDALFQWEAGSPADVVENEEVSARQYFDVAVEPSGNFWLATSDGLFRYSPLLWRTPSLVRQVSSPVRCLTGDQDGRLWFVSGARVYALQKARLESYAVPAIANRNLQVRGLYYLKSRTLVVEAEDLESNAGTQLFVLNLEQGVLRPLNEPSASGRWSALGLLADGSLCLGNFTTTGDEATCSLARYDGRAVEVIADPAPIPLLGTNLHTLFLAQNGDIWVSGETGTACYHEKKWLTFTSSDKSTPEAAIGFVELPDGKIWCADQEQVWEFDGRNWTVFRRGFDRINGLLRTRDGSIWIACNNGLQRFVQGSGIWIENGVEEGLPSATVRELYEDQRGLWAATTHGLSLFHPQADRDPPIVTIQKLATLGNGPSEGNVITLSFTGQDKWHYTPPERLLFSYRLDDGDWSMYQPNGHITYSDLHAGKHSFRVRAIDRNANQSKESALLEFSIVLPWYRETRLVLISVVGLVTALFFAALSFNRHRQLVQSYAEVEKKVAERTLQLEMANQELLQSQKMRALGTLAAGIAHDFNNILSIVKGSAQIIEDNLDNPQKVKSRADRIKTVVDQGAGIVKAMLGFSRDSGQELAPCDVNGVVDDTLKLLGDRFLREVQVKYQPARDLPVVLASKEFIQQILLNFIFNAAESMTASKEILVSSRWMDKLPQELVLMPKAAASYVVISVQDFGCGIAPEILPRIFEPFFTTKALSSRRGTGLGLSMVYELAKKLGAGLSVESALDKGSTFGLILPVDESWPNPAMQSVSRSEAPAA
jgi:signal transduction histidine kinase